MSTEVKCWFSAAEIAMLGRAFVAGLPMSERGATRRAKQHHWASQIAAGKGGKGGVKTEYMLPQEVRTIVYSFLKQNPDFFKKESKAQQTKPVNYQTGHVPTKLTLESPVPAKAVEPLDADLFIYVSIAVHKMLEKTGKNFDQSKRNKLILLIYDYCKLKGECDEEIISKFLNVAG